MKENKQVISQIKIEQIKCKIDKTFEDFLNRIKAENESIKQENQILKQENEKLKTIFLKQSLPN